MGRFSRLRRGSRSGEDDPPADATVEFDVTLDQPTGAPDQPTGAPDQPTGAPDQPTGAPDAASQTPPAERPDKNQAPASYRDRARLRRRLRYLRRARELSFRDLGGFVFDAHRFNRNREDIVAAKLKGLAGMDAELRSLETALDDRRELMLLHEPGISVCPRCATLHGSDANFCSGCGLPRRGAALPLGPRAPLPLADAAAPDQPTTLGPSPSPSPSPSRSPSPSPSPSASPPSTSTTPDVQPPFSTRK